MKNESPILVIYHGHCPDGFAAALAIKLWFEKQKNTRSIDFYAAQHNTAAPDCSNKEVYIVDFSYKRGVLKTLCHQATQVILIDHHISALKDLENIEEEESNIEINFDMQHSGAILTWNYFFKTTAPLLFQYIEDRDIWKFELADTNDVMSAVVSYQMDFKLWESWLADNKSLEKLKREGKVLNRERKKMIHKYKQRARNGIIAGYAVPVVNAPSGIASDLLQQLSADKPFAASYEDREDRRIWQLRSCGDEGLDVSEIATQYGGGGHKRASGFTSEIEDISI